MSRHDLIALRAAISQWPDAFEREPGHEISDACRRALDALPGLSTGESGWLDVAALVRQVLLINAVTYGGTPSLAVPAADAWPTVDQWIAVRCSAVQTTDHKFRVTVEDWAPPASFENDGVGDDLARDQVREVYRDVEPEFENLPDADPFWKAAHPGFEHYRGEPQRQAARAAVLNDGGSVLVALSTGRGKTAVAWSKTLLSNSGVTVVVVPTVVLALDMERRTQKATRDLGRALSPIGQYAYIGSLGDDVKKQLRDAVRAGTQRLIYTSPEAFVTGLATAVIACARAGNLQQVVIDEAHLVDQWGTDFRPEFQTMPGLIRDAYEQAPDDLKPAVLLLSATLAQRAVDVLTRLFKVGDRPVDLVWGSEIRTEPAFFFGSHDDEDSRIGAILEAVRLLPRPLILYTSRVQDAEDWTARLRRAGLHRVDAITGKSGDVARRTVLERWRGETTDGSAIPTSLDIVVGTSAFGLGLDMPNVRTVLHACLPETIDRYYQEVGRAGRDGRPAVAYLAQGPNDLSVAKSLNSVTIIGDERGWKRWQAMLNAAEKVDESRYRTRKDVLPTYLDMGFERSKRWNVRTLTLLAQAGVIKLRAPRLVLDPSLSPEQQQNRRDAFYREVETYVEFELLDGTLLGRNAWKGATAQVRDAVWRAQNAALASLRQVTEGRTCVGRTIARHYRVRLNGGLLLTNAACRGCPVCRRSPQASPGVHPAEPRPPLPEPDPTRDRMARWLGSQGWVFVRYAPGEDLTALFTRMAERHLRVWRVPRETADRLQREAKQVPIIRDDPERGASLLDLYAGPMVVMLSESEVPTAVWERMQSGLPTYLVAPEDTMNPERPGAQLRDVAEGPCISAATLLKRT